MSRWLYTFAVVSADRPVPTFNGPDAALRAEGWLRGLAANDQAALAMYATFLDGWHGLHSLVDFVVVGDDMVISVLRDAAERGAIEIAGRELANRRVSSSPDLEPDTPGVEEARVFAELVNHWLTMASATGSTALFAARALGPSIEDREFHAGT